MNNEYLIIGNLDYLQGHLRYGHYEAWLSEEEYKEWETLNTEEKKEWITDGSLIVDDYRVSDWSMSDDFEVIAPVKEDSNSNIVGEEDNDYDAYQSEELKKWEAVNATKTLDELADVILSFADEHGDIIGRSMPLNAKEMAERCRDYVNQPENALTRSYGIRQQGVFIRHFAIKQAEMDEFMENYKLVMKAKVDSIKNMGKALKGVLENQENNESKSSDGLGEESQESV